MERWPRRRFSFSPSSPEVAPISSPGAVPRGSVTAGTPGGMIIAESPSADSFRLSAAEDAACSSNDSGGLQPMHDSPGGVCTSPDASSRCRTLQPKLI